MGWNNVDTRWENNGNAKLDFKTVNKIRFFYKFGKTSQRELSQRFGVAQTTISKIVRGAGWNQN